MSTDSGLTLAAAPAGVDAAPVDVVLALTAAGGVARRASLRRGGVRDRDVQAAVAAGVVVQAGRGTFALPDAHEDLVLAVRLGGVASHSTAAELHGLDTWTSAKHVTVPAGSVRGEPGVTVHRCDLPAGDVEADRPVTAPMRTLLDCGRALTLVEAGRANRLWSRRSGSCCG